MTLPVFRLVVVVANSRCDYSTFGQYRSTAPGQAMTYSLTIPHIQIVVIPQF